LNYTSNLQRYITEALNEYFYPFPYDRDFAQLRRQDVPSLSVNTNLNYSEPLSKKLTLRFNNQYQYINDQQDIAIFNQDGNASTNGPTTHRPPVLNGPAPGKFLHWPFVQNKAGNAFGRRERFVANDSQQFKNVANPVNSTLVQPAAILSSTGNSFRHKSTRPLRHRRSTT
jgi:hypothetical protein